MADLLTQLTVPLILCGVALYASGRRVDVYAALVRGAAKMGVFNLSILVMYTLVLTVFPMPELAAEYREMGQAMVAVLLVTANIAFVAYDRSIVNLTRWYVIRIRPKLRFLH